MTPIPSAYARPRKPFGRPGSLPLLGFAKCPRLLSIFGTPVLAASLSSGGAIVSPIRCFDNVLPGAKTRTIHTDAGRVKVPASFTLLTE